MSHTLFNELKQRGLIAQTSNLDELQYFLQQQQTVYCGFDPTAGSLHIGHLVPLLMLKRFSDTGHHIIALIGGATGLIGDPSFKASERGLNATATVADWTRQLSEQITALMQPHLTVPVPIVNNADWLTEFSVITFFRDIGKHFSVNAMIRRESVKQRLERPDQGISFTEFSYSLLQAYDFARLNQDFGCTLQIGGNDQWGNIVSGIDLTRRLNNSRVDGLTLPLITKADGTKFGKTESGTIWLDPQKTSPYRFYQFWLNTSDNDVYNLLRYYTFLPVDEIACIEQQDKSSGRKPEAQRILAEHVTRFVHGENGLEAATRITAALFNGTLSQLTVTELQQLELDGLPCIMVERDTLLSTVLPQAGLSSSRSKARELLAANAVRINGEPATDKPIAEYFALFDHYWLLQKGQKHFVLLKNSQS